MGGIGFPELLIVLLVLLLLFGSTKLPKLARSMGQASKEFKKGADEADGAMPAGDEQITLSRSDLDAILAERDIQTRVANPVKNDPPTV